MSISNAIQQSQNIGEERVDGDTVVRIPEISIVIPCLNEEETLEWCIDRTKTTIEANNIDAEIIVADNGSTDRSPEIARSKGARVVNVPPKGYGNALMGGIAAARGKYVLMADADGSYDFAEIPRFLERLRMGAELVQGCRLPQGGGTVLPGAMKKLHFVVGNPLFSWLVRVMFNAPIHDINCGMRAFTKDLALKLAQRCTGMEFAVEMVIKASLIDARFAEVPITLHPDRRINNVPHLRTFRDGWRTLRFFLISSPRWLFLYPGLLLMLLGVAGYGISLPGLNIGGVGFGVNTLLLSSLSILLGYQTVLFSVSAKTFAMTEGLLPTDKNFARLFRFFTLERGLVAGVVGILAGAVLIGKTAADWYSAAFGAMNPNETMRMVVPGVMLIALGFQTVFSSFFLSILGMQKKG